MFKERKKPITITSTSTSTKGSVGKWNECNQLDGLLFVLVLVLVLVVVIVIVIGFFDPFSTPSKQKAAQRISRSSLERSRTTQRALNGRWVVPLTSP
ncbi:MAG: hypothetical protein EHM23_18945 [Acidobacteria bacterium]|nr:MAG: hypothetical protein EHM23_18945 [Acidobacteriota bacterium]